MRRLPSITTTALVLVLLFPAIGASAQQEPIAVPEATAETAAVGEAGPRFETGTGRYTMEEFVSIVIQDTTVMWSQLFDSWGLAFVPPAVVTVGEGAYARSSCGISVGDPQEKDNLTPILYCQYGGELGTQQIGSANVFENRFAYSPVLLVSLPWLERWASSSGAPPEAAAAYRLVHEYNHHVQRQLRYIDHTGGGAGDLSDEQVELGAECLTGVWAYSAYDKGTLDQADVETIQRAAWDDPSSLAEEFGRENRYGTQEQRIASFLLGYDRGNAATCFDGM